MMGGQGANGHLLLPLLPLLPHSPPPNAGRIGRGEPKPFLAIIFIGPTLSQELTPPLSVFSVFSVLLSLSLPRPLQVAATFRGLC